MGQKSGHTATSDCLSYVQNYFKQKYLSRDANFANARDVRNFFEIAVVNQANRLAADMNITNEELAELTLDDVKDVVI